MHGSPTGDAPPPVGACRVCGGVSWHADAIGPVHLCCARWEAAGAGGPCPACAQARENARAQRQRRRPVLLPWPNDDGPEAIGPVSRKRPAATTPPDGVDEGRATT